MAYAIYTQDPREATLLRVGLLWLCVLVLALPALCLAAGGNVRITVGDLNNMIKPIYLSDHDPKYELLERIQADYCRRFDSLPCNATSGTCAMRVLEDLDKRFGGQEIPPDTIQSLLAFCSLHGTRYEPTGSHYLLSSRLAKVHEIARQMSVGLESPPVVGSLPLRELNASAAPFAVPIILVNQRFISFVADFSKIACMSIPTRRTSKGEEVLTDEHASRLAIAQSPDIREAMLYLLGVYLGGQDDRIYQSSKLCDSVVQAYTTAIQSFVVAHEYAHIALAHPPSLSTDLLYVVPQSGKAPLAPLQASTPFLRELEADAFALRVLSYSPEKFSAADDIGFQQNYVGGIEFYFQMREVFHEAAGTLPPATSNQLDPALLQLSTRIARCIGKPNCNVRQFQLELAKSFDMGTHPPVRFRRAVAQQFRTQLMKGKTNRLEPLVPLISRNVWMLWQGARPEWDARSQDKARLVALDRSPTESVDADAAIRNRLLRARQDLTNLAKRFPDKLIYLQSLNSVAGDLGDLAMTQGDFGAAAAEYEIALSGAKKLMRSTQNRPTGEAYANGTWQTINALKRLAQVALKSHSPGLGSDRYEQAIPLAEGLLKNFPKSMQALESLGEGLIQYANLRLGFNDLDRAEDALLRLGKLLDEAPEQNETVDEFQSVRSELIWKLGEARDETKNEQAAKTHYVLAVSILEKLATSLPKHAGYQRLLAQRSTLLANRAPEVQSWALVLDKWRELERRGGVKEGDRKVIDVVTKMANGS